MFKMFEGIIRTLYLLVSDKRQIGIKPIKDIQMENLEEAINERSGKM